ncbi:hypothetical protein KC343_g2403 [Hortaea werneckii]|nr:hypothetical protein KC352_g10130 [Hortaea werneckii]KAI7570169.1 hypothetical protein KC317_g2695 [Hortaea werneckii]KAI7626828.1 hypothetical protein KC346_g1053 [Hortaea werneckii]KAI7634430.1 hypothetical protein KC343_g2403 [Hortaea werneckii]KAI7680341.1 hypothetical protein KC319_g2221 [Hortaea werneckii]
MDNSPLSKLAAETRNQIYELVLCPPGGIQIGIVGDTTGAATTKLVHPPPKQKICSLVATCKAIRNECRSMLYGANVFSIEEPSLPTDIFQGDEAKTVHEQRYAECLRKLEGALPFIPKLWIDVGTWRWKEYEHERSAVCKSLAERCHALSEAMTTMPTTVDVQGLVRISAKDTPLFRESPEEDAAAAGCGRTSAWHAHSIAFLFDMRDLSTLSTAAIQQTFRAENRRLHKLRVKGMMTLYQYSVEIMWLHRYRQRIPPMLAEVVAMKPEYRAQAPKPIVWFGCESKSTSPGMTDDVATAAGDFHALMAQLAGVDMT